MALFTHLAVREDAMTLYGFLSQEEHALFLRLIGVSGIGPKAALAALSTFKPAELISAIQSEDVKAVVHHSGRGQENRAAPYSGIEGQFGAGGRAKTCSAQRRQPPPNACRARATACLLWASRWPRPIWR